MLPFRCGIASSRRVLAITRVQNGKKLAMPITAFERNIITDSLTLPEAQTTFKKLDKDFNGEIDVTELT